MKPPVDVVSSVSESTLSAALATIPVARARANGNGAIAVAAETVGD
jgi:hypothetical protein